MSKKNIIQDKGRCYCTAIRPSHGFNSKNAGIWKKAAII